MKNMVKLQEIGSEHEHYGFVEALLHTAFPENERRDDDRQRWNADNEEQFHCLLASDDKSPVGVLTYWDFDTFIYIEHLAIDEALRGKGYGKDVLGTFFESHTKPVVLEVEQPTDETSRRRISFYERCGLHLWACDYRQPPYRAKDGWFPMYLMVTQGTSFEKEYPHIRETIYHKVYGADGVRPQSPLR